MELEDGYPDEIRTKKRLILHDRDRARAKWPTPEAMAEDGMRPDSCHNHMLFDLLDTPEAAYLRIKPAQLIAALKVKKRRQEHEARETAKREEQEAREAAKQAEREAREAKLQAEREAKDQAKQKAREERRMETFAALEAELGGVPTTEREFIALKWQKDGLSMTFDRQFSNAHGEKLKGEQVVLDMHLTAADLSLVKPRGDLLAATNIDRAFAERCIAERQACVERVCERVMALPEGVEPEGVIAAFERICGFYFKEPIFAARAIQKMIWQIKRMMLDMHIEQRHMCVFLGEQNCGKTFVQRMITAVISELVAEASLKDVLDERQMDLPSYLAILLDELVSADKADSAAWKNFITGVDWARRPMRSNIIEKVKLRASLFGTSNHSLGKLIYDSSGMRRFIELGVLPRTEIEPNWKQITGHNWLQLWQAVDVEAEDPLMAEFGDVLVAKQEELRNADNCETWLRQFESERINVKHWCPDYAEWYANDLYTQFRTFEEAYDRGWRGTSLTRWGRDMKSLIDAGHVADWSYYKYGAKTVYRRTHQETEQPKQTSNVILALREKCRL